MFASASHVRYNMVAAWFAMLTVAYHMSLMTIGHPNSVADGKAAIIVQTMQLAPQSTRSSAVGGVVMRSHPS